MLYSGRLLRPELGPVHPGSPEELPDPRRRPSGRCSEPPAEREHAVRVRRASFGSGRGEPATCCFIFTCSPPRAPSTWSLQTLVNLGALPLYMTSTFYQNFDQVSEALGRSARRSCGTLCVTRPFPSREQKTKQQFLRSFLLGNANLSLQAKQQLWQQIRLSITSRSKRSAGESPSLLVVHSDSSYSNDLLPPGCSQ